MAARNTIQTQKLLTALASGQPVSGAELAHKIGVTRAAVWKHIASLRKAGLPVQAQAGRGYHLPWPIQPLNKQLILQAAPTLSAEQLDLHWSVESTQHAFTQPPADLAFALSEVQHLGRGRQGRSWPSPPGLNIYLSCQKVFEQGVASLTGLPAAAGVWTAQALQAVGVTGIELAWPNDLVVKKQKFAGILIDLAGEYQGRCTATIGVGIHLRLPQHPNNLAALDELIQAPPPDRNQLAATLITQFSHGLKQFARDGFAPFADHFNQLDAYRQQAIKLVTPQHTLQGTVIGVNEHGAIGLQTAQGLAYFNSGHILPA